MTATGELIQAALAAAELFREGDTPDQPEIRGLVRAADAYRPEVPHTADGCLMCAVRELTEGTPQAWVPDTDGQQISGTVLKVGTVEHPFGGYGQERAPFVDLWLGGTDRIRVIGYSAMLGKALLDTQAQVGDRMSVIYVGKDVVSGGRRAGKPYSVFTATVTRGHH